MKCRDALVASAVSVLIATTALADPPAPPSPPAPGADPEGVAVFDEPLAGMDSEARIQFQRGVEALRKADFTEAEARFRRSRALVDKPSTTYDLALALFKLGRSAECRELLAELQRTTRPDDEFRKYGEALLQRLNERVANLTLTISPDDAAVTLDGTSHGRLRSFGVDPGDHELVASAPGYVKVTRPVTLAAGERQSVVLRLPKEAPPPASPPPTRVVHGPPSPSRLGPWLLVGTGGAALVAGLVTGILAKVNDDDFVDQCPTNQKCDRSLIPLRDKVRHLSTARDVLLISGGALVVGGVAWHLVPTFQRTQTGAIDAELALSARF